MVNSRDPKNSAEGERTRRRHTEPDGRVTFRTWINLARNLVEVAGAKKPARFVSEERARAIIEELAEDIRETRADELLEINDVNWAPTRGVFGNPLEPNPLNDDVSFAVSVALNLDVSDPATTHLARAAILLAAFDEQVASGYTQTDRSQQRLDDALRDAVNAISKGVEAQHGAAPDFVRGLSPDFDTRDLF